MLTPDDFHPLDTSPEARLIRAIYNQPTIPEIDLDDWLFRLERYGESTDFTPTEEN